MHHFILLQYIILLSFPSMTGLHQHKHKVILIVFLKITPWWGERDGKGVVSNTTQTFRVIVTSLILLYVIFDSVHTAVCPRFRAWTRVCV